MHRGNIAHVELGGETLACRHGVLETAAASEPERPTQQCGRPTDLRCDGSEGGDPSASGALMGHLRGQFSTARGRRRRTPANVHIARIDVYSLIFEDLFSPPTSADVQ